MGRVGKMEHCMDIQKAVEKLFQYEEMGNRRFSKETYEPSFEKFGKIAGDFDAALNAVYEELLKADGKDALREEEAVEKLCRHVAQIFVAYVRDGEDPGLSKGEREENQRFHNTFMATYVLPHIMEMRNPYYKELAKEIEKSWAAAFKNSKIKAASYETVASGFQRKFLGFNI